MTDIQCDTCDRMLKKDELPENRDKNRVPMPFMPETKRQRMFYLLRDKSRS